MTRRGALAVASLAAALVAVWAASSGTPGSKVVVNDTVQSLTLSIVLPFVLLAIVTVAAALAAGLRHRDRDGDESDTPERSRLLPTAIAGVGLMILAWFAWMLLRSRRHVAVLHLSASAQQAVARHAAPRPVPINAGAFGTTSAVIVALVAVFLLRHRIRRLGRGGRAVPDLGAEEEGRSPTPPSLPVAVCAPASSTDLGDPDIEIDPRRAIVLAYQRFAAVMARAGLGRSESETPFEYASRLGASGTDTSPRAKGAATALTSLFSAARYSRESISPEDRSEALSFLSLIADELGSTRRSSR
jgi:hypothetical protein